MNELTANDLAVVRYLSSLPGCVNRTARRGYAPGTLRVTGFRAGPTGPAVVEALYRPEGWPDWGPAVDLPTPHDGYLLRVTHDAAAGG